MTQRHLNGKTTKTSAFSQIIEKDSQEVKTLKWSKTPRKYLDKKDNFWLKMLSRRITTWQTCHKLKRLTYAKKCKSILAMFTSNYNPYTTKPKPCYGIPRIFVQPVFMYLYLFLPPLPHISYHSPQPLLAIVNNAFCGQKTQMREISFFHMDQNRFRIKLTEKIYKISLCWEEEFILYIPLWKSRGPGRTDAWTTRRKLLKSFSQPFIFSSVSHNTLK